jgi:anti-sigma B factor antagonist
MKVSVADSEDLRRISIEGSIDGKTAPMLREELKPSLETAHNVLLDMSGVDYMSSAGLRLLLLIYREFAAKKGKLVLVGLSPDIRSVMSHTGFLSFFKVADDEQQAAKAFAAS